MAQVILLDPGSSRLAVYFEDIFQNCLEDASTVEILKTMYSNLKDDHRVSPILLWVLASALGVAGLEETAHELEDKLLELFPKNMCSLQYRVEGEGEGWDVSFLNHYISERLDATGDLRDVHFIWKAHYCLFADNDSHYFDKVLKWKEIFEEDPHSNFVYNRVRSAIDDEKDVVDFWVGIMGKIRPIWGQHALRQKVARGPPSQSTYHEFAIRFVEGMYGKSLRRPILMTPTPYI
jgi:hypothetical protein